MKEQTFIEISRELDPEAFWQENERCGKFSADKPRCGLFFSPDDHWLFEFLDVGSTIRYYREKNHRDALHKEANEITRKHVGKTFFEEDTWEHAPKRIENLFGSEYLYEERGTPWLQPATNSPEEFARILDRVETTAMKDWALPEPFLKEWYERKAAGKPLPALGTGGRGPATILTSVLTAEDVFFWMEDHPELMKRFSELLSAKMIEFNRVLREFSGNTHPGWWITDDNCALFNREWYKEYCYPVLEAVLNAFAPGDARRYQHSDSNMEHLLDYQNALGIREVNYGPEIDVRNIRLKMPGAMIQGHMPPFMLRNAGPEEIRQRVISDFEKAGSGGGLTLTTAGSLAAGTGVGRMRWLMLCTQKHCRYD
ncbi:MAG: uroporphyrinogen decarboxylase family protein [Verrucomicrobiae bacterium]